MNEQRRQAYRDRLAEADRKADALVAVLAKELPEFSWRNVLRRAHCQHTFDTGSKLTDTYIVIEVLPLDLYIKAGEVPDYYAHVLTRGAILGEGQHADPATAVRAALNAARALVSRVRSYLGELI